MFMLYLRLLDALWFILPAYFANSFPVNVSKIKELEKYGTPVDGGREFMGVRIFGDGKTWRGFYAGIIAGTVAGILQAVFQSDAEVLSSSMLKTTVFLPQMGFELAFMLSLGAILGDLVGSFVKRRAGLRKGSPAPLLDQLDFAFGALFFAWLWYCFSTWNLNGVFEEMITYDRFFVIVIITPGIHVLGNIVAWLWKLKKEPW